jgi:hypothetical protein
MPVADGRMPIAAALVGCPARLSGNISGLFELAAVVGVACLGLVEHGPTASAGRSSEPCPSLTAGGGEVLSAA